MSTYDPQNTEPFGTPPKKRGMSTGAKVAIILVVVFGGFAVLCCGGMALTGWWFSKMVITDPKEVAAKKDQIATIDIPARLKPAFAMDMTVPVAVTMVIYADDAGNILSLGTGDDDQRANMQRSMEQSLQKQRKSGTQQNMVVRDTRVKTVTVRGEKFEFSIQTGTAGAQPRVRVNGEFPGDNGRVVLMLDADANVVSDADIDKMLESIK